MVQQQPPALHLVYRPQAAARLGWCRIDLEATHSPHRIHEFCFLKFETNIECEIVAWWTRLNCSCIRCGCASHAMSGGVTRTTSDLLARLPDVSKATVYRHVSLLAEAGVLEVVSEQRVHGAVERRYRLHRPRAVIDPDAAASMTSEEHRHGFAAAMAALVAEFNTYLDQGTPTRRRTRSDTGRSHCGSIRTNELNSSARYARF